MSRTVDRFMSAVDQIERLTLAQLRDVDRVAELIRGCGIVSSYFVGTPESKHLSHGDFGINQTPLEYATWLVRLSRLGIKTYAEIGSLYGWSGSFATAYLLQFEPTLRTLLIDPDPKLAGFHDISSRLPVRFHGGTSFDLTGEEFDAVFIDGDHYYHWVENDWLNLGRYARICGIQGIAGLPDDPCDDGPTRFWNDLKLDHRCEELIHVPGGRPFHGIGVVYVNQADDRRDEPTLKSPRPLSRVVAVNNSSPGIGDAIMGLAAVGALHEYHPGHKIVYRVPPDAIPFIELFWGYDHLTVHDLDYWTRANNTDLQMSRNDTVLPPVPRWQRYANSIGINKRAAIRLRDPLGNKSHKLDYDGVVVLCPYSTRRDRDWSLHHWLTLEEQLNKAGYRTVVMHSEESRMEMFKSEKICGQSALLVVSILLNAVCVIANDSGLAHLAGAAGCPTIVLCAQTRGELIFDIYEDVTVLSGSLLCTGCYCREPWYQQVCKSSCASLQTITPETVTRIVEGIAERKRSESLVALPLFETTDGS